ncbi:MAG TPA: DPP IV N-terminal domain-containing protein, partial [Acidobacteriota bacterium]|nr:DPP IV N-terminal domain-containing protein [Acidobacteriota bacterium]
MKCGRYRVLLTACLLCLMSSNQSSLVYLRSTAASSQSDTKQFPLTIDSIMRGPDLVGEAPTSVRWSPDSQKIYFEWKKAGDVEASSYEASRDGHNLRKLSKEDARQVPPAEGEFNRERTLQVFARDGDIFLWSASDAKVTQLTKTRDIESNPRLTPDGKKISFARDNNLYVLDLSGAAIQQLTDFRTGPEPKEPKLSDSQKFLQEQQKELFEVIQKRLEKEAKDKKEKPEEKPIYLQGKQTVQNLTLSPTGSYVSFTIVEPAAEARSTIVPSFVTKTGYTEDIPSRTKVGDAQGQTRIGIYQLKTQKIVWVGASESGRQGDAETRRGGDAESGRAGETGSARQRDKESGNEISTRPPLPASPRPPVPASPPPIRFLSARWSEDGKYLAALAVSRDSKTRSIYLVDPEHGALTELDTLHDDAWVGPLSMAYGWMPDNRSLYFLSEKSGYAQ